MSQFHKNLLYNPDTYIYQNVFWRGIFMWFFGAKIQIIYENKSYETF